MIIVTAAAVRATLGNTHLISTKATQLKAIFHVVGKLPCGQASHHPSQQAESPSPPPLSFTHKSISCSQRAKILYGFACIVMKYGAP